jgi:transcriptional regulator with PAS, ATPase and Fis domain
MEDYRYYGDFPPRFQEMTPVLVPPRTEEVRLIGQSEAIQVLRTDIDCAARSDAKVLITGETGVGKEVVSRLIHHRSGRASAPLVTLNCAGLPDSLLESELFGHVRGSFTGAYRDKPGLLEMAPNGTVFLDEVGEMSTRMQVVLLRFLETGEIQRIGSNRSHTRVNVRLVTATNRDLHDHIASGAFREDLYFRLNVIRLCIPPLRERREDIPLLFDHFLDLYARQHHVPRPEITSAAMDVLLAHRWPGNIREVKNVIERIILKGTGQPIRPADLPADLFRAQPAATSVEQAAAVAQGSSAASERLAARIFERGESFWATVYPDFMSRDLTRDDLRKLIQMGLERSNGNYRLLVQHFNMPPADYKRFLSFLRKHNCHLPFQRFRVAPARLSSPSSPTADQPAAEPLRAAAGAKH